MSSAVFLALGFGFMVFSRWMVQDLATSPQRYKAWSLPFLSGVTPFFAVVGPMLVFGGLVGRGGE